MMLNDEFNAGPFVVIPGRTFSCNDHNLQTVYIEYDGQRIGEADIQADATRSEALSELQYFLISKRAELRDKTPLHTIRFVTPEPGAITDIDPVCTAKFMSLYRVLPGMTPGWAGDEAKTWVISEKPTHSMPASLNVYADLRAAYAAEPLYWVAQLLSDEVLTTDPAKWRAPTEFELRHVVGEHSFTQISGAKAAELVGVTPQNFRKYTAKEGAASRQKMSFAMWHLLLHKLDVRWLRVVLK